MRPRLTRWPTRPEYTPDPAACEHGGHSGPFLNGELYDSFPGWEGYGECARCGSTVIRVPARERGVGRERGSGGASAQQ